MTRRTHALRVGVAGLGRMGKVHAANLAVGSMATELAAVVDPADGLAESIGRELGVPASTRFERLLEGDVDAIVIATPPSTHAELIERSAAGGKHVLCEKPLAYDRQAAERAVEVAQRAGIKLQVGFQMRFHHSFVAASERIAQGALGRIYHFDAALRDMAPPHREYLLNSGGYLYDAAIHGFDLARWLVGEIAEVSAFGAALSHPDFEAMGDMDNIVVVLRFENGALGVIDNSRVAGYGFECRAEVMGEGGTVRVDGHRRTDTVWLTPGRATEDRITDFSECFAAAYVSEIEDFASAIRDDRPVRASGRDGLVATLLCLAAEDSLLSGRTVEVSAADERPGTGADREMAR